jgi:cytoskeletal protein RodZ
VPLFPIHPLLGASDPLISLVVFVLFVVGSALLNWFKRRQQEAEAQREQVERARRTGTPVATESTAEEAVEWDSAPAETTANPKARSWEEELKRLLEGDFANPPPTSRPEAPAPPPVVIVQPRPQPPPLPRAPEPVLAPLPPVFSRGGQTEDSPSHEEHEGTGHLATLTQSAQAYDRASHLSNLVAAKLAAMDSKTAFLPPETKAVRRAVRSTEMINVLKQLRSPASARQVILAQTVLGTPKALER